MAVASAREPSALVADWLAIDPDAATRAEMQELASKGDWQGVRERMESRLEFGELSRLFHYSATTQLSQWLSGPAWRVSAVLTPVVKVSDFCRFRILRAAWKAHASTAIKSGAFSIIALPRSYMQSKFDTIQQYIHRVLTDPSPTATHND